MEEWIALAERAQDLAWVRAIVVVGFSVLIAKVVDLVISRFLLRLTMRSNTDLDDQLVALLHRPIFISVILLGLFAAVRTLGWNAEIERIAVASIHRQSRIPLMSDPRPVICRDRNAVS